MKATPGAKTCEEGLTSKKEVVDDNTGDKRGEVKKKRIEK
jgi:hypothetical protein